MKILRRDSGTFVWPNEPWPVRSPVPRCADSVPQLRLSSDSSPHSRSELSTVFLTCVCVGVAIRVHTVAILQHGISMSTRDGGGGRRIGRVHTVCLLLYDDLPCDILTDRQPLPSCPRSTEPDAAGGSWMGRGKPKAARRKGTG